MKAALFLTVMAVTAATSISAQAIEYNLLQADRSTVSFVFRQMNVPVEGRFKHIKGQIGFDPARPANARAEIDLELTGIDAGSEEANDAVAGKLWFNTKVYPTARFVTTSIRPLGNNRFDVTGKLSIKGRTRDISAPATLRQEAGTAIFEGGFAIRRADFAIGEGDWADFGTVANEVQIRFRLVAIAAARK